MEVSINNKLIKVVGVALKMCKSFLGSWMPPGADIL
jgi:hypothetical protein